MQRTYCVFNQTSQSFVALNVHRLDTVLARLNGLLRRLRTKSNECFWVPSRGIHTVGLLAPVDLIYLDAQNRVIQLVEQVSSFRIGPLLRNGASVLNLPRHTIYSSQTHVGDQLLICPPEEMETWLKKAIPSFSTGPGLEECKSRDGARVGGSRAHSPFGTRVDMVPGEKRTSDGKSGHAV